MLKTFSLVGGASLGAGLMFILDPDRGRRLHALVRDKGVQSSTKTRIAPVEKKRSSRLPSMQPHWTLAAGLMGSAALLYGLNQRRVGAPTVAFKGTNRESPRLQRAA